MFPDFFVLAACSMIAIGAASSKTRLKELFKERKLLGALYLDRTYGDFPETTLHEAVDYIKQNPFLIETHLMHLPAIYRQICESSGFSVDLYDVCLDIAPKPFAPALHLASDVCCPRLFFGDCPPGPLRTALFDKLEIQELELLPHFFDSLVHKNSNQLILRPKYYAVWGKDVRVLFQRFLMRYSQKALFISRCLDNVRSLCKTGDLFAECLGSTYDYVATRIMRWPMFRELMGRVDVDRSQLAAYLATRFIEPNSPDKMRPGRPDPDALFVLATILLPKLSVPAREQLLSKVIKANPLLLMGQLEWKSFGIFDQHQATMHRSFFDGLAVVKVDAETDWTGAFEPVYSKMDVGRAIESHLKSWSEIDSVRANQYFQLFYGYVQVKKLTFPFPFFNGGIGAHEGLSGCSVSRPGCLLPDISTASENACIVSFVGNLPHGCLKMVSSPTNQNGPTNPRAFLSILLSGSESDLPCGPLFLSQCSLFTAYTWYHRKNLSLFFQLLDAAEFCSPVLHAQFALIKRRSLFFRLLKKESNNCFDYDQAGSPVISPAKIGLIYSVIFRIGSFAQMDPFYRGVLESVCFSLFPHETGRALALSSIGALRNPKSSSLFKRIFPNPSTGEMEFFIDHYITLSTRADDPRSFVHLLSDSDTFDSFRNTLFLHRPFRYGQMVLRAVGMKFRKCGVLLKALRISGKVGDLTDLIAIQNEAGLDSKHYLISPTKWIGNLASLNVDFIVRRLYVRFTGEYKTETVVQLLLRHPDTANVDVFIQKQVIYSGLLKRVFDAVLARHVRLLPRFVGIINELLGRNDIQHHYKPDDPVKCYLLSPRYIAHLGAMATIPKEVAVMHHRIGVFYYNERKHLPISLKLMGAIAAMLGESDCSFFRDQCENALQDILVKHEEVHSALLRVFPGSKLPICNPSRQSVLSHICVLAGGALSRLAAASLHGSCSLVSVNFGSFVQTFQFPHLSTVADLYAFLMDYYQVLVVLQDQRNVVIAPSKNSIPARLTCQLVATNKGLAKLIEDFEASI